MTGDLFGFVAAPLDLRDMLRIHIVRRSLECLDEAATRRVVSTGGKFGKL